MIFFSLSSTPDFQLFLTLTKYITKMANEVKVIVYMTTIIASGYALMKYTVPDEEAMKKVCLLVHSSLYVESETDFITISA